MKQFPPLPTSWVNRCPYQMKPDAVFIEVNINAEHRTYEAAFIAGLWIEWTAEKIKRAFNFGAGTLADLRRYADDNRQHGMRFYSVKGGG